MTLIVFNGRKYAAPSLVSWENPAQRSSAAHLCSNQPPDSQRRHSAGVVQVGSDWLAEEHVEAAGRCRGRGAVRCRAQWWWPQRQHLQATVGELN